MKISLNLVKKYIDLPKNITTNDIALDMTVKTVEIEDVINTKDKYHDIVVGKILEVKEHPNAEKLRICITDIGEDEPVQIVCGGSNLYENEYVVVSKPGAEVVWHGEGEPVKIEEVKMRGVLSYGMICAAKEVYLSDYIKQETETEIVDLKDYKCEVGQNICEVIENNDVIIEVDNKSLTNRPDLWGHYGIARELSTIYETPLKEIEKYELPKDLPKYNINIEAKDKCKRYIGIEIDNVSTKQSPLWMRNYLINCGLRPINAIVDITNYVMIVTGQPTHAFDSTHIDGKKIIVRNAHKDEKIVLLDELDIDLTEDDLVICDEKTPLALAGIKGGIKDSILPETNSILLEIANFDSKTIRKTEKRFSEKTDSGIRYEKGIDTQRVDQALNLSLNLIKEIFPESKIISYGEEYVEETKKIEIDITKEYFDTRLGVEIEDEKIKNILTNLGYSVDYKDGIYHVITPTWRSTGDVSLKEDLVGEIARIIGYDNFNPKPLPVKFEHAIIQNNILLENRIREYLSYKCGFDEIMTYPWIEEKYIDAVKLDKNKMIKLATPPSPDMAYIRSSLTPGLIEAVVKNLRYYDEFKIYEMAQVYEQGEYHESSENETLPLQHYNIAGCIVGKDAIEIIYELKGIIENLSSQCHMEEIKVVESEEKHAWADINASLDILKDGNVIGSLGLLSISTMMNVKIKHTNVAMFELNFDKLVSLSSRTNTYEHLSELPLIEKDLSIVVDEDISWKQICEVVKTHVKEVEYVEEYRGEQIPNGKKSIMFNVKIENQTTTMSSEEINQVLNNIVEDLNKNYNAILREQ